MIHILTLKVGDRYDFEYINKLHSGIRRNYRGKFQLYCYTEKPGGISPEIKIIEIPESELNSGKKMQFFKNTFFKTGLGGIPVGDEIIVMDIDIIFLKDITKMIEYPCTDKEIISIRRWWASRPQGYRVSGGWYKFKAGTTQAIYDKFNADIEYWQSYYWKKGVTLHPVSGEQNFTEDTIPETGLELKLMPPEWTAKFVDNEGMIDIYNRRYKKHCNRDYMYKGGKFHEDVLMVHFAHRENAMGKYNHEWIKNNW